MLFHIPSSSLVRARPAERGADRSHPPSEPHRRGPIDGLRTEFDADEVAEAIRELVALELIDDGRPASAGTLAHTFERFPLTTVVLNVNTGCNLSCTYYCYKGRPRQKPSAGCKMAFGTARDAIEMMLRESPDEPRYNVVFFGGEPLSNLPLIKDVVAYLRGALPSSANRSISS